jgi:TatD DNase family protein
LFLSRDKLLVGQLFFTKEGVFMFIDTHCHLGMMATKKEKVQFSDEYFVEVKRIVEQAKDAGIEKIINIGASLIESTNACLVSSKIENVFASVAIHPCDCSHDWVKDIKDIEKLIQEKRVASKIIAIGETGLDFYHKPFDKQRQEDAFRAHIELALTYKLPLVLHVRDAADEFLKILEEYSTQGIMGVVHCFSQNESFANTVLNWGFYLGIGAYITYPKNIELRELLKKIPLNKILLETDAPFLPPQIYRGKPNHPAYIPLFAPLVGDLVGVSVDVVEEITTKNANHLFKLDM